MQYSASNSAYCYTFFSSVVCFFVRRLSRSCTLLKPFAFRCHLACTLLGSSNLLC